MFTQCSMFYDYFSKADLFSPVYRIQYVFMEKVARFIYMT